MLSVTKPKVVFCDGDNAITVREALIQSHLSVPIYVFGQKVEGFLQVEELFAETGNESDFR